MLCAVGFLFIAGAYAASETHPGLAAHHAETCFYGRSTEPRLLLYSALVSCA